MEVRLPSPFCPTLSLLRAPLLTLFHLRTQYYEEITIPAPKAVPFRFNETLVPISDMDPWGKRTFHVRRLVLSSLSFTQGHFADPLALVLARAQAYKTLNRLQSIVFPVGYKSNENMLVCAPTGAARPSFSLSPSMIDAPEHLSLTPCRARRAKPTSRSSRSCAACRSSPLSPSPRSRPRPLSLPPRRTRSSTSRRSRRSRPR